jgi:hypothetical protein
VKTRRTDDHKPPAILHGARALALLSLVWSGYAITDLMHSGPFGLSVAVAGDIGWITVLWAEWRGIALSGRRWAAPAAGWLIAAGVTALLVLHGAEHSRAQAIAGPFVVLVGKIVWAFALAAMKDPAAPTPEQQAEIHAVMRDSAHEAAMLHVRAQGRIARIQAEASVTLARDEADFEIGLERLDKQAEIQRRTPLAIAPPERPAVLAEPAREQPTTFASTTRSNPSTVRDHIANSASTSTNTDREQPSIADLVREQVASTTNNRDAVDAVMAVLPAANRASVSAAVRRERRNTQGYA